MTYTCREYHACQIPAKIPAANGEVATPFRHHSSKAFFFLTTFRGVWCNVSLGTSYQRKSSTEDTTNIIFYFNIFWGISSHISFGNFQPKFSTKREDDSYRDMEHVPESIHVTVDVRILARIDDWSIPLSTIRKPQYRNLIPKKIINQGHYKHHILFQHFLGDVVACFVWKLPTKILNQAWR